MTPDELKSFLEGEFPESHVQVNDLTGTSNHYEVIIEAARFKGLSRIARHRLVYGLLSEQMRGEIHALSIVARDPDEGSPR